MSALTITARRHLAALLDRFGARTALDRVRSRRGELRLDRRTARRVGLEARARRGALLVAPIPDARTRRLLERAAGTRVDVAGTDAEDPRITLLVDRARPGALPARFATVVVDTGLGDGAAATVAAQAPVGAVLPVRGIRSRRVAS